MYLERCDRLEPTLNAFTLLDRKGAMESAARSADRQRQGKRLSPLDGIPVSVKDNLFVAMKDDDWDQVLNVNLTSTFRLARAAVKLMMRKRFGRIIGITSVVGITGNPGQANYTATKAGMIGMFKSIGKEYAKRGVTANCVAPGFIATPMTDKLNDKQREAILQMVPAGRLGVGSDVAAAVVYLASNEAAYVTGQTLHVNGGMAMI